MFFSDTLNQTVKVFQFYDTAFMKIKHTCLLKQLQNNLFVKTIAEQYSLEMLLFICNSI